LESYKHIELTPHEMDEAILWRKQKKEKELELQRLQKIAEQNRRNLTGNQWSYEQTKSFMLYRASQIFTEKPFVLDPSNQLVFELLCYYFSSDVNFLSLATNVGIDNPSLEKGLCLAGVFGVGKSWMVKLFQKNQRQVYFIRNAKQIAKEYQMDGAIASEQYENKFKNPVNDSSLFYQPFSGLCIDDLGTEDIKNSYGNKSNVIGDLIELRYSKGNTGPLLHATTNFTSDQIEAYYGPRVRSRMREIFNFIELPGNDRRK
jgi:DNA replication protein DnaC